MPLGTEVNLGPGDVVLDGVAAPPKRGTAPSFRPMSIVSRSRISATAELLFIYCEKICRSDSDTTVLQVDADYIKKYNKTYASCISSCKYTVNHNKT